MLLIDLDTDVPSAIWNIFLHSLVVGAKSYHIYFKVILSINSWHFTLNIAYRHRFCSNKGRQCKTDGVHLLKPDWMNSTK